MAAAKPSASGTFLVKSEPTTYGWDRLVKEGKTRWDGVRNYTARNSLRAMKVGDLCLFYHSNEGKEVVGVAKVVKEAYPDPTAKEGDWSAVDLAPAFPLVQPVTLATMREHPAFTECHLFTRARLSVMPFTTSEFAAVLKLGKTKAP